MFPAQFSFTHKTGQYLDTMHVMYVYLRYTDHSEMLLNVYGLNSH